MDNDEFIDLNERIDKVLEYKAELRKILEKKKMLEAAIVYLFGDNEKILDEIDMNSDIKTKYNIISNEIYENPVGLYAFLGPFKENDNGYSFNNNEYDSFIFKSIENDSIKIFDKNEYHALKSFMYNSFIIDMSPIIEDIVNSYKDEDSNNFKNILKDSEINFNHVRNRFVDSLSFIGIDKTIFRLDETQKVKIKIKNLRKK